ncbi:MAG: FxLYD domain-containing protein [Candidatus Paceibacterota bacterium]
MSSRRIIKQLIYGALYLLVLLGVGFLIYQATLKPAPSCTDGKKNQDETGIDCGGSCQDCAINTLKELTASGAIAIPAQDSERSSIYISLENPNASYGATEVNIEVTVERKSGAALNLSEQTFIYPSERKGVLIPNISVAASDIVSISAVVTERQWQPIESFARPKYEVRNQEVVVVDESELKPRIILTGLLRNENAQTLRSAEIIARYRDANDAVVAVSQTQLESIAGFEEESFELITPVSPAVLQNIVLEPILDVEIQTR